jgi:predicted dehydrogenase
VDLDSGRRAQVTAAFLGIRVESDLGRVLADVDAVVIATPTSTHFGLAKQALRAGKHVLCEKPLPATSAESIELVDLARRQDRALRAGFVFLHNAGIQTIKQLVDGGELGSLHYLSAVRTNLGPIRSDVNVASIRSTSML